MTEHCELLIVSQPQHAGVPRHVLELLTALDGRYRVTVACPEDSELWAGLDTRPDVRRRGLSLVRRPSLADLRSLALLLPMVRRADVVHGHSSKAGFLVRLAAVLTGRRRRCIFTPHGWSWWAFSGRRAALYRRLERWAAPWCRAILTVSEYERDAGLASGVGRREQYRVVRNGVSLDRFTVPRAPVPGRVIMVGRLAAPKRHDLALRALALLRERMPQASFDIVGEGPLRPSVEALVRELRLGDRVRLLGQRRDVPELLAQSSCLLLASDYEGCPLTVLEGMAAGLPVVATRFGGLAELVDDGRTGRIVDPEPAALAAALEELLGDPARAYAMGTAAQEEARARFGRERMAAEIEAVYAEVAGA